VWTSFQSLDVPCVSAVSTIISLSLSILIFAKVGLYLKPELSLGAFVVSLPGHGERLGWRAV